MLTFTKALEVTAGDKITSTQHNKLARAFNDRLRAFQFIPWRIAMWWFNLWRQVRNPGDGGYVFPPQAEFFDIYQHLDPENDLQTTWPVTGPGEPEGANLANPMMAFVFGNPDIDREDARLSDRINLLPPEIPEPGPQNLEAIWALGKIQRGAFDPSTGGQYVPAFDAAQDFFRVVQPFYSPHGKSYGGFFPTPVELLSDCDPSSDPDTGIHVPSYEFKFTALRADVTVPTHHGTLSTVGGRSVITYAGSCPCGTEEYAAGHIIFIQDAPFAYFVYVATGDPDCSYNVDRFPKSDWLAGPYEGVGTLQHDTGKHLDRVLWAFAADFRGTDSQRNPDDFDIEKIAFDNEAFYNRQYYLAPNIGVVQGNSLFELYPRAEFNGTYVKEGTFGRFTGGETQHIYKSGFVLGGMFAKAKNLFESVRLDVIDDTGGRAQALASLTLTPDKDGAAEAMLWLEKTPSPQPLRVRLGTAARFRGIGSISIEFTEQYEYKPQPWDAYLVARLSATGGGTALLGSGVDGRGRDYALSAEITKAYFANGCIVNPYGVAGVRDIAEWVNDNPVYDAARRLARDHARIVRRQNLVNYEVPGDGTCILRFKRFAFGLDNIRADMFAHIAPPLDPVPSGGLIEGETYIVRATGNGSISYGGNTYRNNHRFTGIARGSAGTAPASGAVVGALADYQSVGDAQVFVYDGIRHAALKKGFTNEWVMFLEAKRYHPSASSIWKPDAYSDYFAWCQRCHFYSGTAPPSLRRHIAYNYGVSLDPDTLRPIRNPDRVQAQFIAPEAPDQYNYALGANQTFGTAEFHSSCRIYEAPYEIESCVVDDWQPDQVIKLTLKQRLRSHPDAPATINKDPSTWSAAEVQKLRNEYVTDPAINEDYRTDDNSVREYMLHQVSAKECTVKIGDAGTGSGVDSLPDNPLGCCYPHFFFCRMLPEVFEDDNDTMESHDTRAVIDSMLQAEVYLRAGCEGFVDGRTSQDIICRTGEGSLFEYKFENLCFDAFSGREIGCFPLAKRVDASGFGPLPNSIMYAEVFNRLVKAVNLLTKCRIDLPVHFLARSITYHGERPVTLTEGDGSGGCALGGYVAAWGDGLTAPAANTVTSTGAWAEEPVIGASSNAALGGCPYLIGTSRTVTEYRIEIDPDFWDAVPAPVLELFDLGQTGFLALKETSQSADRREAVAFALSDGCCLASEAPCPGSWFGGGNYYRWVQSVNNLTSECLIVNSGTLEAPGLLSCDYKIGRSASMASGDFCLNGPSSSASLTLVVDQGAFIEVPFAV